MLRSYQGRREERSKMTMRFRLTLASWSGWFCRMLSCSPLWSPAKIKPPMVIKGPSILTTQPPSCGGVIKRFGISSAQRTQNAKQRRRQNPGERIWMNHCTQAGRQLGRDVNSACCLVIVYGNAFQFVRRRRCVFRDAGPYSRLIDCWNIHYRRRHRRKKLVFFQAICTVTRRYFFGPWSRLEEADVLLLNHYRWSPTIALGWNAGKSFWSTSIVEASKNGAEYTNSFLCRFGVTQRNYLSSWTVVSKRQAETTSRFFWTANAPLPWRKSIIAYQNVYNTEDAAAWGKAKKSSLHTFLPAITLFNLHAESMDWIELSQAPIIIAAVVCVRTWAYSSSL